MVETPNIDEAYKIVNDAGIGSGTTVSGYEQALGQNLLETYALLDKITGVPQLFQVFRYEYDALNLKVLIKSQALGKEAELMQNELGTVPQKALVEQFKAKKFESLPPALSAAGIEALDVLARTGDPQMVDIIVDKAMLKDMYDTAMNFDNRYLHKIIRAKIDIANLRCLVRIKRMDKSVDFFKRVAAPGGNIDTDTLIDAYTKGMDQIVTLIESSNFGETLEPAMTSVRAGEGLSLFEKLCDNALINVYRDARLIPFGIEPIIAYLGAKENELRSARIILASRVAGVAPDLIKERLRETYAQ